MSTHWAVRASRDRNTNNRHSAQHTLKLQSHWLSPCQCSRVLDRGMILLPEFSWLSVNSFIPVTLAFWPFTPVGIPCISGWSSTPLALATQFPMVLIPPFHLGKYSSRKRMLPVCEFLGMPKTYLMKSHQEMMSSFGLLPWAIYISWEIRTARWLD